MAEYCEYMWDPTRGHSHHALARSIYQDQERYSIRDKKLAIKTVRAILHDMPGVEMKDCTDEYITRFLLARKYRTEQAAALIAAYQAQIAHRQDIFGNLTARDPFLQRALRAGIPGVLPARDKKGRCVLIILASQWDPFAIPALVVQRAIFLVLETLIQDPRNQQSGFVAVVDWSGFSLRQGGALGAGALRNLISALRGRFPARFKAIHFLSAPLYVQATLALVKPFLDEKTRNKIDPDRKVISVSCTCVYNKSEKCKHVAAVIYYINNIESLSKTDEEQQWGKPTNHKLTQEKYAKGKNFYEMFPPRNILDLEPFGVDVNELLDPSPLKKILLEAKKDKISKAVHNMVEYMLSEVEVTLEKEDCLACVNIFVTFCENTVVYSEQQLVNKEEKDFYFTFVALVRKSVVELCCDTLKQSKCSKWFEAKSLRLSASKQVHSIKTRKKKTIETLVCEMLDSKKIDTPALRYGNKHESDAMKKYEEMFNVKVHKVGLLVSEKQPWLCASLDGVVLENGCIQKIVEFKCPFTCEKVAVIDLENNKSNVKYFVLEGNKVYLRTSNVYYTQCQVQMYVSGVKKCDLFVYSPVENGCCCVTVDRNERFLRAVILKCEEFYFQHYLPKLMEKSRNNDNGNKKKPKQCFTGSDISNKL